MEINSTNKSWLPPKWLRFLVIILLVLGIFFRFVNLERRVYESDETFTSLRLSGYTELEIAQQLFDGHEIGIKDLQNYQHVNPDKGLIDSINSLAIEDVHPPLYFVLARLWVQWFGNSVAVTRSLSAFVSLLVFPAIYWLCLELFKSPLTGWIAIAFLSVSPFHLLYSREARMYSLLALAIVLSSAALLRAMRTKTKFSWGIYGVTLALGFYSHFYFAFLAMGHVIYVLLTERFQISKTFKACLFTSILGFLALAPWIGFIFPYFSTINKAVSWTSNKVPFLDLVRSWPITMTQLFFDVTYRGVELKDNVFIYSLFLILVGYSIYFLCRSTQKDTWLFVLVLIGSTALALALPDLILGGRRSGVSRYLLASYLGCQLAVAHFIATKLADPLGNIWKQKLWQIVTLIIISSSVLSCVVISQAQTWSKGSLTYYYPRIAELINKADKPLLISRLKAPLDDRLGRIMSLSYVLDPKVKIQLVIDPNIPQISAGYSDVFLFWPSSVMQSNLPKKLGCQIDPVFNPILWQCKNST